MAHDKTQLSPNDGKHDRGEDGDTCKFVLLSELYVLAEMLMDATTKDIILAAIQAQTNDVGMTGKEYIPDTHAVRIIYQGTPEGSPARQFMVNLYTESAIHVLADTVSADIPKDFLYDLTRNMMVKRPLPGLYSSLKEDFFSVRIAWKMQKNMLASKEKNLDKLKYAKESLMSEATNLRTSSAMLETALGISRTSHRSAEDQLKKAQAELIDLKIKVERARQYIPRHLLPNFGSVCFRVLWSLVYSTGKLAALL